jgi:hypothetical protein
MERCEQPNPPPATGKPRTPCTQHTHCADCETPIKQDRTIVSLWFVASTVSFTVSRSALNAFN